MSGHAASMPPGRSRSLGLRWCSDERLAQLAADGDARGLALLYERHHQALYRYCRSIVRNEQDAQDALQATMTGALGALGRLEPGVPVRAWLFRIAHNASISLVRQRRTSVAPEDVPDPMSEPIEATLARRAELAVLVADLQDLPERQRAALVMRELSGLAHEEIGIALSISTGAAKQAIFEARSALAEFAEGRTMACDDVRRAISDGDGRVLRGRRVRAHPRDCSGCADFRAQIPVRRASLATLAPQLPAAASAGGLAHLLGGGHGSHNGLGAAAGAKAASAPLGAKLLVTGLVVAAAAGGVTHSGLPHHTAQPSPATAAAPAAANRAAVSAGGVARLGLRSGRRPASAAPSESGAPRGGRASSGQAVTAADPISTDAGRPAPEATSASGLVTGAHAAGSGRAGRGPATQTPRRPAARGPGSSGGKGKRAHTARSSGAATSATRRSTRVPAAKRSAGSASATSATPTSTPPPRATQAPSPPAPGQPAPAGQGSGGAH